MNIRNKDMHISCKEINIKRLINEKQTKNKNNIQVLVQRPLLFSKFKVHGTLMPLTQNLHTIQFNKAKQPKHRTINL